MSAVGYGVPLLVVAFVAPFALAWIDAPLWLVFAAPVVPGAIGGRGMWLIATGGVTVGPDDVRAVGWFRRAVVPRREVRRVVVRRVWDDQPLGWLDLGDRQVLLRGAAARHRHGLSPSGCDVCAADLQALVSIAEEIGVPIEEVGRPAAVSILPPPPPPRTHPPGGAPG
jgi:hypothetical protein